MQRENMLKLFALGAAGVPIDTLSDFDFHEVMHLAIEQGVWQLVLAGVKTAVQNGDILLQNEEDITLFHELHKQMLASCIKQDRQHAGILNVINQIREKGIPCCVLKGAVLAALYKNPACRISGDVDVLVPEKDEDRVLSVFRENGFTVGVRAQSSNHDKCYSEELGMVEVHVSLYYGIMQDVWFDNVEMMTEPFREQDGMQTLGITDGYLFTLLHTVKHFLSNRLWVKQIMDVLLYEMHYKDQIDFERVDKVLTHLKYKEFSDTLKGFGVLYFGLNREDFRPFSFDESKAERILKDVFQPGKKKADREFFEVYNACRYSTFKNGDFNRFMTDWRRDNVKKVMSFSRKNMYIRYPYAAKNHLLLPVAWINHLYVIAKTGFKRFSLVKQSVKYSVPETDTEQTKKRLEMFKDFDMI